MQPTNGRSGAGQGTAQGASQDAGRAVAAGDLRRAAATLEGQLARAPQWIVGWLNLAAVRRQLDDVNGAFLAIREVLRLDPRNFPALLMSASLMEREGNLDQAAIGYAVAIAQAPPDELLDPATRAAVHHGEEVAKQYKQRLGEFVRTETADVLSQCTTQQRRRIDMFVDTTLRVRKRYQQDPMEYYFPGLPSIEFYERENFPWLEELESATNDVRAELLAILEEDRTGFAPYVHYEDHVAVDQWAALNHSPDWTAYHFYDAGRLVAERAARAPKTIAAVQRLPQPSVRLRSPTALYSALTPRTRIPPHNGVANFRLLVHLPLIIPGNGFFRVGGETREWKLGTAWVFDDTIEHEARNDSDQLRVILICDIWNPLLTPEERLAIDAVIGATDRFHGTKPTSSA